MSAMEWNATIVCIAAYIIASLLYCLWRNHRANIIFENIKIIAKDHLPSYLIEEAKRFKISETYRVDFGSEQEYLYASEILEAFRKYETECFFQENKYSLSRKDKELYRITSEGYFIYSLFCYLYHQCECPSKFYGKIYNIHDELSDFGRVYYKIYLVASIFCEHSDSLKPLIGTVQTQHIISVLDNNKL